MRVKTLLLLIFASMVLAGGSPAAEHPLGLNDNHPYGRLTSKYVTPHVKWANPYYKGDVKVLVMAPVWSQRETVELAQRLSIDYTAWMTFDFSNMHPEPAEDPAVAFFQWSPELSYSLLRRYLQEKQDVIIIGKLHWEKLPDRERFELLKKVSEGTGLIYVCPPAANRELDIVFGKPRDARGADFITGNLPLSGLPQFKGMRPEEVVRTSTYGKGRVVVLDYGDEAIPANYRYAVPSLTPIWDNTDYIQENPPMAKLPEMEFVPYEYYHALLAKAVLWAGKKEPTANIESVTIPARMTWPVSGRKLSVQVKNAPSGAMVKAKVRDRHEYGVAYEIGKVKAGSVTSLTLPGMPAGEYFLDVWLLSQDGKTIDWASSAFSITADFSFADISLGSSQYNMGDKISGAVGLSRSLKKNESITIELWDNHKRRIQTRRLDGSGTSREYRFSPLQPLTIMHRVIARLVRDGKEVSSKGLDFPVRARLRRDDFNEIVWASSDNYITTHLMLRKLAKSDQADVLYIGWRGATFLRNIGFADLAAMPYVGGYGVFRSPDHIVPEIEGERAAYGCMSSPVTYRGVDEWADKYSRIFGPYGPFAWSHGDESYYSTDPDICRSPTCLAAFRTYLKDKYDDLAALNAEWKTSFGSWEEVMPVTFEEAEKSGNYAPWIEHRLSSARVFARFYEKTEDALSRGDSGARAGFDGPQSLSWPNSGLDWWLLSSHVGILQDYTYNSESMEILRSFAKPEQVSGMWYGTYGLTWQLGPNTVEYCHFLPWYSLFHGLNSTWFWTMGHPGLWCGYAPDLTNLPFFESRTQALKEIKSGIGKLLLTGERSNDKIAIHYSDISRIADSLYSDGRSQNYMWALSNFNKALEDTGLQYEYVSYEEIEKGDLIRNGYRALIMPHSRAVSAEEAEQIRRFVSGGGVVVADILPGALNGHGTRQQVGMLSDLFPSETAGTITTYGQGKAVLAGNLLDSYGRSHNDMNGWLKWAHLDKNRAELASLLKAHAGISPAVKVTPLKADKMPPTEVTRLRCGEITFVSLLREYYVYDNAPYDVAVEFPSKSHIYDVRSGRYLGMTNRIDTSISYKAHLYALSPYKVQRIDLHVAGKSVRIDVKTSGGVKPSSHVFRLEVISPDGENIAHYAQNVLAKDGVAATSIPWALNDKPGKYTITARDVMSGSTARRTITLK